MSTTKSCDVCHQAGDAIGGPVDFYGVTGQSLGIPIGHYHYACASALSRGTKPRPCATPECVQVASPTSDLGLCFECGLSCFA